MTKMLSFLMAVLALSGLAQEETTRQIWRRPPAPSAPGPGPTRPKPANVTYRPVGPAKPPSNATTSGAATVVGVTLWKLRPAKPADGARLFVLPTPGAKGAEEVPERVDPRSVLTAGDHFRLTVEAPANGYLYVIDREQYQDGTTSAPYPIYPNYQTRSGDNVLAPGRLIEIPDQRDPVNAFELLPGRADEVAEIFSLVLSPEPLPDFRVGRDPLPRKLYDEWEKKWGVEAEQSELDGASGQAWTPKEKHAGGDHGVTLTEDDPLPQTKYRFYVKPGSPALILVPLKIKR
ncbi:MAG TPA: hypothetical protein VGZ73_26870 [Bryobacteraceae bacterium]|jgi:hypothetical protein|nr:hypothetical protein [Bryobacteraceae bacterium]